MDNALTRLLGRGKGDDETSKTPEATEQIEADDSTDKAEAKDAKPAEPAEPVKAEATVAAEERGLRSRFGAWLGRPMTSFHIIIAVATLLTSVPEATPR